jgi:hypothetical protein
LVEVLAFLLLRERLPSFSLSLLNLTNVLTITNNNPASSKRPKRAYFPPAENNAITNERKIYAPTKEAMIWNIHLIFFERSSLKIGYLPDLISLVGIDVTLSHAFSTLITLCLYSSFTFDFRYSMME